MYYSFLFLLLIFELYQINGVRFSYFISLAIEWETQDALLIMLELQDPPEKSVTPSPH